MCGTIGCWKLDICLHERTIFGFFFVLIVGIGCIQVDAGETFQRCEECRCHVVADPTGYSFELFVRQDTRILHFSDLCILTLIWSSFCPNLITTMQTLEHKGKLTAYRESLWKLKRAKACVSCVCFDF